jgi:hypothetical protein
MTEKRARGNPNFVKGNKIGHRLAPPVLEGEATFMIGFRLPESLKSQFDLVPGTPTQKLRQAVELLIAHHQLSSELGLNNSQVSDNEN